MLGKTLAHYEILRSLGRGGMGEVYLARDTKLGREVALKLLPEDLQADPDRRARFQREAQTVAALNHPHVVTVHAVEEAEGRLFLVMEFLDGQTLDAVIGTDGLPLGRLLDLALPLTEAVAAAHARGVTHRDLKPGNVMLDREGRLKVLDFGLAKLLADEPDAGAEDETIAAATREGTIVGTAAYMSPEQAEGKPVDARSDVFSLGILLYQMATGRRPFAGDTQMSTLTAVLRDDPRPLLEIRPDLPRQLARIIRRCLEKDPDRRHESARGLRYDLEILREELDSGEIERPAGAGAGWAQGAPHGGAHGTPPSSSFGPPHGAPPSSSFGPPHGAPPSSSHGPPHGAPPSSSHGSSSYGPPPPAPAASPPGRRPPRWAIAAVVVVGLGGSLAWLNGRQGGTAEPAPATVDAAAREAARTPTIVVFPFENLGPPEDAYFAVGITEEITTSLTGTAGLRVLSRTSARNYDRAGKTMTEVAADLGVDYVLEGSVRWQREDSGESRVRVTPQLVRASTDEQVWAQRYDRAMAEIFTVQSEIAGEVVRSLGARIGGTGQAGAAGAAGTPTAPTENVTAYHAYLRAVSLVHTANMLFADWREGIGLLDRAVALDPQFHQAWVALARAHSGMVHFGWDRSDARRALAEQAVARARALAPEAGRTHYAEGSYFYWARKDYDRALAALERARRLRPDDPEVLEVIAYVYRRQERYAEAAEILTDIIPLAPRDSGLAIHVAETLAIIERFDEALQWAERAIASGPDQATNYGMAAWFAVQAGERPAALAYLESVKSHDDPEVLRTRVQANLELREFDAALTAAQALPELHEGQYQDVARDLAVGEVLRAMGRPEAARESFARAVDQFARLVAEQPQSGNRRASYARALGGVGRHDDALRELDASFDLFPASRDPWIATWRLRDRAHLLIQAGRHEEAVAALADLMQRQTDVISPAILRDSPWLDPLRGREDFRRLVGQRG